MGIFIPWAFFSGHLRAYTANAARRLCGLALSWQPPCAHMLTLVALNSPPWHCLDASIHACALETFHLLVILNILRRFSSQRLHVAPPRLKVPSTAAALQGTLGQSRDGMAINGLRAAALKRRPHHRAIGKVVNTRCQRLETSPRVLRKVDGASHHSKGEQWSQRPPRLGGGTSSGRCAGSTGGHQPQRTMLKVSVHLKSASCSPRSRCIFP